MKVLILGAPTTNGLRAFGIGNAIYGGGWVENLVNGLSTVQDIELFVSYFSYSIKEFSVANVDSVNYIGLPTDDPTKNKVTPLMKDSLRKMMEYSDPDVINIVGSERKYNYELLKIIPNRNRVVVSFTGIVSYITQHYLGQIDTTKFRIRTIGDILRNGGPLIEQKRMSDASINEKALLTQVKYVSGRTSWDHACAKMINPNIRYFYCGEILNDIYFMDQWSYNACTKHTIFISQGSYPLKGLHRALQAFPEVLEHYPDAVMRIAGPDILKNSSITDKVKRTTYAKYLIGLIKAYNIPTQKIVFTGPLSAHQMKEEYLKANVFVMPSIIENSPNSIGEAMALGVPIVASYVGGIPDMVEHCCTGFLYASDEPYMLSHYIKRVFDAESEIDDMSKREREAAANRFDKDKVISDMVQIYRYIEKNEN